MLYSDEDGHGVHQADLDHDGGAASRGLLRQGLLMVALGGLLLNALECVHRTHRRRSEARPAKLPERLQTWEGEGGRPDPEPAPTGALLNRT